MVKDQGTVSPPRVTHSVKILLRRLYVVVYLPASFTDDCTHGNVTILTETEGYLALFTRPPLPGNGGRDVTGRDHGSKSCPWLLTAEIGKRFNVSWRLPAAMSPFGGSGSFHGHHDLVEGDFDTSE